MQERITVRKDTEVHMKVLIVYYSMFGNVFRMAQLVAEGVREVPGAEPVVRTVSELIPESVIASREDMTTGRRMQEEVPLVTLDDFREAGAIAFGTPTRFGNVSAQLKNQIDRLSSLWGAGELEGKAAGVFVSTGSLHGGQETTILTLMAPLLHLGMILVGVPYSVQELFTTKAGGSPYGPGHVAGPDSSREVDQQEAAICRAFGRRLAEVGQKLSAQ
jgi:NAD(P)H dehydrogenase (quinone)